VSALITCQRIFTGNVAKLITWANAQPGLAVRFGEAYRTPEQAAWNAAHGKGIAASLHTQRLAIDLLLDKDGVWQASPEAYAPLGAYWKSLDPNHAWGGDFTRKDANHFSYTFGGVK
jgi:hypothetical protein